MTLQEVLQIYLQLDRSAFTNQSYSSRLGHMIRALGEDRPANTIEQGELVAYMAAVRAKVKPSSYANYMTIIGGFWRWCVDSRYCEHNPAAALKARAPRKGDQVNRAMPPDVLQGLLDATRRNRRNYAMMLFLADTGCRVGGLVSLRLSKLDLDDGSAILHEKGDRYYKVFFNAETAAALRRWLEKRPACDHDFVFTSSGKQASPPLSRGGVSRIIIRVTRDLCGKAYGPHSIRHAVGHALAKAGVPVTVTQKKLGHSTPAITMAVYYPDDEAFVRRVLEQHPLAALDGATPKPERAKIIQPDFSKPNSGKKQGT